MLEAEKPLAMDRVRISVAAVTQMLMVLLEMLLLLLLLPVLQFLSSCLFLGCVPVNAGVLSTAGCVVHFCLIGVLVVVLLLILLLLSCCSSTPPVPTSSIFLSSLSTLPNAALHAS